MAIYQPSQETFNNQRFSMILYGAPGVGKTTAACSAPNPILIDLDAGQEIWNKAVELSRASEKSGFILGFKMAVEIMRECSL